MKAGKLKLLAAVAALIVLACLSYRGIDWYQWRQQADATTRDQWRERADAATGVRLELRPNHQVIRAGESLNLEVTIVNGGNAIALLVEPGDGSEGGWRTPIVEWSSDPSSQGRRLCGNINGLRAEEVFILKPGESRKLCEWIGRPRLPRPGRYRVAVRYANEPDQPWLGVPLREHDAGAMQKVRQSTAVSTVSNAIEIVVEE